ncbi:MAG: YDG domain-containing protein, partial [Leptospirales bacterium]
MKRTRTLKTYSLFQKIVAYALTALIPLATMPVAALALPHGGIVSKGSATLGYSTGKLMISQSTNSATFDWGSYSVKAGQSVVYSVPGSKSVSMNYIGGTTPSSIDGKVVSNGILYFMNPNGLIFGSGSVVSASGVMAFGSATPWGTPTGPVTNAGVLTATNNGTVALVGSSVTNSGTITAPGGEVILAAGSTVTPLTTTGVSSLSVATTGGGLVDDSGIVSAETLNGKTGTILLQSGMGSGTTTLESTAVLDASALNGGNGGNIAVNGNTVTLDNLTPLNVSAPYGKPGTVTIDPSTINTDVASCLETIDQSQSGYLTDTIDLTGNIDLKSGSNLYSWTPFGTSSTSAFTGTFNGNGYVVSGYTIGTSGTPYPTTYAGFVGVLGPGGKIENLGVTGAVYSSNAMVGGLVGSNFGSITDSYATGNVSSTYMVVGGLVGCNWRGTITNSYATGSVSGGHNVGGLVGCNGFGTITNSYATGSVSGSYTVGGLVGCNAGTISNSYATGTVSGGSGLVGVNCSTISNSYWYETTSGLTASNFSGFAFNTFRSGAFQSSATSAPWFMGTVTTGGNVISAPILVGDMPSVTVSGNSLTTYNGTAQSPEYTQTVTGGAIALSSSDIVYTGTNAGYYSPVLSGTTAPTTQTGTAYFASGSLITPAPLTVTGVSGTNRTYNGTDVDTLSGTPTISGTLYNSVSLSLTNDTTGTLSNSGNAGTDTVTTSMGLSGTGSGNYSLTQPTLSDVTITQVSLSFSGSMATPTKVYDGTTTATLTPSDSSATLSGIVQGQSATYTGSTGTYASPNAGTGISVAATLGTGDFSSSGSGFSWSNYSLPSMTLSGTGTITPAPLTVTGTSSVSRAYNGTDTVGLSGATLSGTLYENSVVLGSDTTGTLSNSGNVGTDSVTTAMTLTGTGAGNFSLTQPTVSSVSITPAPLTVTGTSEDYTSRTYNGTDTVGLSGATLSGNLYGNSVVLGSDTTGTLSNSGNVGTDSVTTA